jgi:putative ABC transport system substrate-binding protein
LKDDKGLPPRRRKGLFGKFLNGIQICILSGLLIASGMTAAFAAEMSVAVIRGDAPLPYEEILAGFQAGLKQQEITAGVVIIPETVGVQRLTAQLASLRPDIIACIGKSSLELASQFKGIPKIVTLITYENLQPWAGRDDIYSVTLDLTPASQFRVIRQAFPDIRRLGILYNPKHNQRTIDEAKRAAATMGFTLLTFPVNTIKEIPAAFEELEKGADLLLTLFDQTLYSPEPAKYLLMQSLRKRIPAVGFSPHFAKAGAPLAVCGDYRDMGEQASGLATEVFKGGNNVVRMTRPRVTRVAVNEKVGKLMGITFTPQFMKTVQQIF